MSRSQVLALKDFLRADHLARARPARPPALGLGELEGRVTELSGRGATARYTLAARLLHEAQREGAPTAWVGIGDDGPFPPDLAACGIDLGAMPFVRTPDAAAAARAAVVLSRSGAFRLIVVDLLGPGEAVRVPVGALSRLSGLTRAHEMAVLFLTDKGAGQASLHSLVSLRGEGSRARPRSGARWRCRFQALKDKQRGPGWATDAIVEVPEGLA